jgi:hypothetical protein
MRLGKRHHRNIRWNSLNLSRLIHVILANPDGENFDEVAGFAGDKVIVLMSAEITPLMRREVVATGALHGSPEVRLIVGRSLLSKYPIPNRLLHEGGPTGPPRRAG